MSQPSLKPRPRQEYAFGEFTLDLDRGCLLRGGEEIRLRPKVFDALRYLVLHDNRLVTKDELIKALWPDSFVTDDSLVQCLVEVRRALGDEAPACIKTVPRRGYIFTAEVSAPPPPPPAPREDPAPAPPPEPPHGANRARRTALAVGVLAAAAVAVSYLSQVRPPARTVAFTEKDSVLVADFVNTTGDEVFDGTLRQAVAVQLAQSPYLDIFPDERVRETLRYMGRPSTERLTRDLAREIAQRQGVKAVLAGSIASLGRHYGIHLEALGAATGETIARDQVEAESREKVLSRLGESAARLREKLGESLGTLERFAAPIEQATTPSLEAFKAYDLGRQKHFSGKSYEAIPLYRRAVELDPGFAIAYAALGITHGNVQQYELAARYSQRAFSLRDRVSERERFYISLRYYMDVLHDGDKAIETLELWRQTYPRDFRPPTNLAVRYCAIGRHERALEEAQEAVRLNPDSGLGYASVALSSMSLGRFREAREAIEQAMARKLEPPFNRYMLYGIAFMEADAAAMREQVEHVGGTPAEAGMLALQSATAASTGDVRRAREFTRKAVDLALQRGSRDGAGLYSAGEVLWEAAYGNCRQSKQAASRTLALERGRYSLKWSALAAALCGERDAARELMAEMVRRFPHDSFYKSSWLPMIHAALATGEGHPARAVDLLEPAAHAELGIDAALWPAYLRGLAHLDKGAAREAAAEFQKILGHEGVLAPKDFGPVAITLHPLAYLGRARAAARAGDVDESRIAYEAFLDLWKHADPDVPVLRAARREYGQLGAVRRAAAPPVR